MKNYKKAQIIILLTGNNGVFCINSLGIASYENYKNTKNYHLYIVSDDEIKKGDWRLDIFMNNPKPILADKDYKPEFTRKIIATTDTSLHIPFITPGNEDLDIYEYSILPGIPYQFIEKYIKEYNKGNLIKNIFIEYEWTLTSKLDENRKYIEFNKLKINSENNTINIKVLKENWSKEEVIELIRKFNTKASDLYSDTLNEWINKNI